jgi:hypothetical protein
MKSIYVKIGNKIQRELKRELARQRTFSKSIGKSPINNTGALSNSMINEITFGDVDTIRVKGLDYGKFLNDGYGTPFTSNSGVGANPGSNYIRGLQNWLVTKKGLDPKEALKKAFAIAKSRENKQSPHPNVKGWIDKASKKIDENLSSFVQNEIDLTIQGRVDRILNITI